MFDTLLFMNYYFFLVRIVVVVYVVIFYPVMAPISKDDGGAECAGRVHTGTRERNLEEEQQHSFYFNPVRKSSW